MYKLVLINLKNADLSRFEKYEKQVLPVLEKYGARLDLALRSADSMTETHVLHFPDTESFDGFLSDPLRVSLQEDWKLTDAISTVMEVDKIDYTSLLN